jgi:hypothetical protein
MAGWYWIMNWKGYDRKWLCTDEDILAFTWRDRGHIQHNRWLAGIRTGHIPNTSYDRSYLEWYFRLDVVDLKHAVWWVPRKQELVKQDAMSHWLGGVWVGVYSFRLGKVFFVSTCLRSAASSFSDLWRKHGAYSSRHHLFLLFNVLALFCDAYWEDIRSSEDCACVGLYKTGNGIISDFTRVHEENHVKYAGKWSIYLIKDRSARTSPGICLFSYHCCDI